MTEQFNLPVFPIDVFILPGGITRLRIFEPKYLTMVSLSSKLGGFIISKDTLQDRGWGSWVEIINFNQSEDGILEVDVKCKSLVDIVMVHSDNNNLKFAQATMFNHWANKHSNAESSDLSNSLIDVFHNHQLLKELYDDSVNNNPYWVVSRWLELLPISFEIKSKFVNHSSYTDAKNLIKSVIFKN